MDAEKALGFVQIATYELCRVYLGELATDEVAVAKTRVPVFLGAVMQALYHAREALLPDGEVPKWGRQAVGVHADGFYRLETSP